MSATLKELCAAATPGPWSVDAVRCIQAPDGNVALLNLARPLVPTAANAELIARLSPETVLALVEAAEESATWMKELADDADCADWCIERHNELAARLKSALAKLDATPERKTT